MFRHVQKQRKLAESNKELQLSDEDSSGNSASEGEEDSASEQSGSEDESGDEESGDEEEGSEGEESAGQEEEEELLPPPPGYPTAEEALKNPIALPDSDGLATADIVPVCVVCPSKALKPGKMLEVHLGSKVRPVLPLPSSSQLTNATQDHTRRLKRFTSHVLNTSFPSSSLAVDARSISAQLDTIILARLSAQTQFGGPSAPTKRKAPPSPPLAAAKKVQPTLEALKALVNPTVNDLKNLAAMERRSLRAVQREARSKKNLAKRMARREKFARLKTATKAAGRELTKEERKALLKVAKVEKPGVKRCVSFSLSFSRY